VFPFILFGGFFSNNKVQLNWLSWIQYISPIKYATEALIYNEFTLDPNGIGNDFESFLNYSLGYNYCIAILIALMVLFRILAFVCLRLRVRKF
jgi:ATP-binding cassette, subfamily G (WHITE), eye pigment precursor transporter